MNQKVAVPEEEPLTMPSVPSVLGATAGPKHVEVDLTHQRLYAYEGDKLIYDLLVSTGKRWYQTPTGTFHFWIKLAVTRMVGGNRAIGTYYNLPNIHYTMYFYNDQVPKSRGFGTHEAYWHNNFGHPMSHGCINMRLADAKALYDWADPPTAGSVTYATADHPGTPITIYGTTPVS
jgi:lipoprotein-anchoring transpeptidase ErfK/SrfK